MSLIINGDASNVTSPLIAVIASLANNGSGAVRVATSAPHLFATADIVQVDTSVTAGTYTITVIDATHFDLVGSTYSSTAAGIATDLSLTPQVFVPTDGDTGSLQLSGLLSALKALADRDQYLNSQTLRYAEPAVQNFSRAGLPATATGLSSEAVTAMAWAPLSSLWLMGAANSGAGCKLFSSYGRDVDAATAWTQVAGANMENTSSSVPQAVCEDPVTAGTYYGVCGLSGSAFPYTSLVLRRSIGNAAFTTRLTLTRSGVYTSARLITFAGRVILAVGSQGSFDAEFTSSADGFTTHADYFPAGLITAIGAWRLAASSTVCVAVPYQQVTFGTQQAFAWTTPDGINWTQQTLSFLGLHDQCSGLIWDPIRSLFVMAVQTAINAGTTTAFYTSPDGVTWTQLGTGPAVTISDMAQIGPLYICSEVDAGNGGPSQTVWSANGGASWYFGQAGFSSNEVVANVFRYAAPQFASPGSSIGLAYFNTFFFRFSPIVGLLARAV